LTTPLGGIPLGQLSGSDAVDSLHATIKEFNEITTKHTITIVRLTWTIAILTMVMTIAVVMQIYLVLAK
jgi:hypothetical protein